MILVVSHKEDYTTDYLVNILNKKNISYHRLNTDDIGVKHTISYNENSISIDGIQRFESVWFRRIKSPSIEFSNKNEEAFFLKDFKSFLNNLWNILDTKKWISHPEDISKAENKLYQLKIARNIGFKTPKTIISTNNKEIRSFYSSNNGRIIIKPLFSGKFFENGKPKLIFTNRVKRSHIFDSKDLISFPMIFQEEIVKLYEIRVTIVNNKVFSAKVDSQTNENTIVDWRKDIMTFTEYNLPIEISNKCIKLLNDLNLKFGAIDLIKTASNYIFLEINPNGQWVWIENDTGLKISDEIIKYLM